MRRSDSSNLSLKVPVSTLVEKVEVERQRIIAEHKRAKEEYASKIGEFRKRVSKQLRAAAERPEYLAIDTNTYSKPKRSTVRVALKGAAAPPNPEATADTWRVDRDLGLLKATTQDTITVRADSDLSRYL